jgi:hypothetical protein
MLPILMYRSKIVVRAEGLHLTGPAREPTPILA